MREEIRYFQSASKSVPFYLEMVGTSYCDGSYKIIRNNSNITVIEYVVSGEGTIYVNGNPQIVYKDQIYILRQNDHHEYFSSTKNPWVKIFMNIYGALPEKLLSDYNLSGKYIFEGIGMLPIFKNMLSNAFDDNIMENVKHAKCASLFLEIVATLSMREHNTDHSQEAVKLKNFLDSKTGYMIGNEELSRSIFRSTDYTVKLFKKEFGTTPYDYQLEQKMQTSRYLLANTRMSIGSIGEILGFTDQHYFSNLFKKKNGVSPKKYRMDMQSTTPK